MGVCDKIRSGLDMSCISPVRRNYQQVVIVNRADVRNKSISTSYVDIDGDFICRHRVMFDLNPDTSGFRYMVGENVNVIFGSAEKTEREGIPQYAHSIAMVLTGVDENSKCILSNLDRSDYFAAVKYYDGTVEIYGFEYGLTTGGYTYDPTNTSGGVPLKLVSNPDALEDDLPFIYASETPGNEGQEFDDLFANHEIDLNGDFNDDFNNDFNNQGS